MMVDRELLKIGDHVDPFDLSLLGPLEVPIPKRWYLLRVHPHREFKVMKTFRQRNISGWLPLLTSMHEDRRNVTSPLISGVIIIPDFEVDCGQWRWRGIDGVIGVYMMDECMPFLKLSDVQDLRNIEAIGNTPKSKRARLFEIGQLVRVVNGPFRQFCARVEERFDSKGRLSVGVEIFGRITPTELAESDIEAV